MLHSEYKRASHSYWVISLRLASARDGASIYFVLSFFFSSSSRHFGADCGLRTVDVLQLISYTILTEIRQRGEGYRARALVPHAFTASASKVSGIAIDLFSFGIFVAHILPIANRHG